MNIIEVIKGKYSVKELVEFVSSGQRRAIFAKLSGGDPSGFRTSYKKWEKKRRAKAYSKPSYFSYVSTLPAQAETPIKKYMLRITTDLRASTNEARKAANEIIAIAAKHGFKKYYSKGNFGR